MHYEYDCCYHAHDREFEGAIPSARLNPPSGAAELQRWPRLSEEWNSKRRRSAAGIQLQLQLHDAANSGLGQDLHAHPSTSR